VFLHGGPGASVDEYYDVNFKILDPNKFTVLEIDQLGTGRSEPSIRKEGLKIAKFYREVRAQDLVETIVKVFDFLKWDKVYLHGGSWGSTLALIFAEMHPERVSGMVLRGIFTGTKPEMDNIYTKKGASSENMKVAFETIFEYAKSIGYTGGENNSEEFVRFFRDFFLEDSPEGDMAAWNWWVQEEKATGDTDLEFNKIKPEHLGTARSVGFWESHIFYEMLWGPKPLDILGNISKLPKVPIAIVQGKGDEICPPVYAQNLERALLSHGYDVSAWYVDDGHKVTGGGIRTAVREAAERFAKNFLKREEN